MNLAHPVRLLSLKYKNVTPSEKRRHRHWAGGGESPEADSGIWSGGQWSFDPKGGALSPKFAQNRRFSLKIA